MHDSCGFFAGLMSRGWPEGNNCCCYTAVLGIFIAIHSVCRHVCLRGEGTFFFTPQIEGQVKIKTRVRTFREVGNDHRY